MACSMNPDPDTLDAVADVFHDEAFAIEDEKVSDRLERISARLHRKAAEERHR